MNIEIVMRNILMSMLPSIYLYILGTYILVKFYPSKNTKLLAASVFFSAISYTLDFIHVLLPTPYNQFLQLYGVQFTVSLSFVFMMYVIYCFVQKGMPLKARRYLYTLYSLFVLQYFMSVLMYAPSSRFSVEDGIGLASMLVSIAIYIVVFALFYTGYQYKTTKAYRSFFKVCLVATVIAFAGWGLWQFDFMDAKSTSALWLSALTCTVISFAIVKLKLIPSKVQRYAAFMNTSATAMVILDRHKRVLEVNSSGKSEYEISVNTDFGDYFNYANEPFLLDQLFARLDAYGHVKGHRIDYINKKGMECIVLIDASKVIMADEAYYYCMIHEVTLEFQRRHLNEHLAYHDVLTGIYNRTYFEEEVKRKLAQSGNREQALMICDLNFFKEINDTYGHQTGDNVLIFTANCWHENLPKPHILARLGGDEFVMFFEEIQSKKLFLKQIEEARNAFRVNLFKQGDIEIEVVPSIGIAFVQEDGIDYEHLYHTCDVRMYEDKKIVKEQYSIK